MIPGTRLVTDETLHLIHRMIARVYDKTGATVRAHGVMYKVVDKLVLLYGSESLVVTRVMLKFL